MDEVHIGDLFLTADSPIKLAILAIDRSRRLGIALVVDAEQRLVNTLTDGDVRRGMLAGLSLEQPVGQLLEIKKRMPHPLPVVASATTTTQERLRLMKENGVRQLPILDSDGRILEVDSLAFHLDEMQPAREAIVMAGGIGRRLHPLTEHTPKPMLPVGGRPLLEILFERLNGAGIKNLCVTTHFKPEKIVNHFGDGRDFGLKIDYVNEESPLGTAGALSLLPRPNADILVVNGDILTHLDFSAMFDYHLQHRSALTVAVRSYEHVVPYGVVRIVDSAVVGIDEKPAQTWFVSAGIYILAPCVFDCLVAGEKLDMPDLIQRAIARCLPIVSFPIREKWIDIGQHQDYQRANSESLMPIAP